MRSRRNVLEIGRGDIGNIEVLFFVFFLEVKFSISCYFFLLWLEGKLDGYFVIVMYLNLFVKDLFIFYS